MKKEGIKADSLERHFWVFTLWEIAGAWVSIENSTSFCICRSTKRKNGEMLVELRYQGGAVFQSRIINYFGIWQIDFFGHMKLAYDREKDLLYLSDYGFYKRADESLL